MKLSYLIIACVGFSPFMAMAQLTDNQKVPHPHVSAINTPSFNAGMPQTETPPSVSNLPNIKAEDVGLVSPGDRTPLAAFIKK